MQYRIEGAPPGLIIPSLDLHGTLNRLSSNNLESAGYGAPSHPVGPMAMEATWYPRLFLGSTCLTRRCPATTNRFLKP